MKWFLLILLVLPQNKTVPLKGVTIMTAPGVPSAPMLLAVR